MTGRDHSLGPVWTPVEAVVAAARVRAVFLMVWDPDSLVEHREVLITSSPDCVWAIHRSRTTTILGWAAVRIAPDGTDLPGTLRWLGAADANGSQVVGALLGAESLPTARP